MVFEIVFPIESLSVVISFVVVLVLPNSDSVNGTLVKDVLLGYYIKVVE